MSVIIVPSRKEAGEVAAAVILDVVRANPQAVLGLATGSSPLETYQELAAAGAAGTVDFSQVRGFALDEYIGIPEDHPESYHTVIRRTVTEPLGLNPDLVQVPSGTADDPARAGKDYDAAIKAAGGVDVQILGIGANGHLGFNEPTTSFASRTHVTKLTEQTRTDNARFFEGDLTKVPTHSMTQGLGTISEARKLLLIAQGENKADAIAAAVEGPVSSMCPASLIQLHPDVVIVVDEAAASKLTLDTYERYQG